MGRFDDDDIEELDDENGSSDQEDTDESEGTAELAEEEDSGAEDESPSAFTAASDDDGLDEYDDSDVDLEVVDEALSQKDQNARALAIRRAIEERLESKRLSRDLDYLDLDFDD